MSYIILLILYFALYVEWVVMETPCYLCYLQRTGLIGMVLCFLIICRCGFRARYYILCLLFGLSGFVAAMRLLLINLGPESAPYFVQLFGLGIQIWSLVSYIGLLILLLCGLFMVKVEERGAPRVWKMGTTLATYLLYIVIIMNLYSLV